MNLLILHGPNLNLLGEREPEIYGSMTLAELNAKIGAFARELRCKTRIRQSNSEGELIDILHANRKWAQAVVFNPGAYTHYSYALRDAVGAIASLGVPTIEVHLSDIKKREKFRRTSVIAPACLKQISGYGWESYTRAIQLLAATGKTHGR
ncbi:MAG: 3-dehydroquinate dehydratase [Oligoflexia bacterium]|nr:3-dehydroquinate dehydratase [Oligoflexia bacterium]